MVDFIIYNKDWIFSGVGLFLISIIFSFFRKKPKENFKETKGSGSPIIIGNKNKVKNEKNK